MRRTIILLLVVIAAAAGGYAVYKNLNSTPSNVIHVSGNIELEEVNIGFKTSGKLVERTVDEGDNVTKGEVIARLDKDQLLRQRDREVATLAEDEAQLAQSRTSLQMQTESTAADLDSRQADLTSSQSKLDELKAGARPQELAEASSSTAAAQAEFDRAKKDWDRSQQLHKDDDISTSQFDQSRKAFESAQANLNQAKQHEELVKEGSRKEDVDQAQAQLLRTKAGIRTGEANALDVKRRQQDVVARSAEIDREHAQIALIDSQLADTTAISPINGCRAGEEHRCRRSNRPRNIGGDCGRPGPSVAARLHQGNRSLASEARRSCDRPDGCCDGQDLQRESGVHFFRSGIYAEADSDHRRTRETGLPHQDRYRQSAA